MGINKESDVAATLAIGPTSMGMVRIYVEGDGFEIPMDFDPDEALEIAEELRAAAEKARGARGGGGVGGGGSGGAPERGGQRPRRDRAR